MKLLVRKMNHYHNLPGTKGLLRINAIKFKYLDKIRHHYKYRHLYGSKEMLFKTSKTSSTK